MCIRDRGSIGTDDDVLTVLDAFGDLDVGVADDSGLHGLEAVSYTHLRAHETVLDLVCRLLLEKKKKHTSNTLTRYAIIR